MKGTDTERQPETRAYLRVSTDAQDVDSQRVGIEDFCRRNGWTIAEWVEDEGVSGAVDPSKRKLGALVRRCRRGDRLVFGEISRIGRKLDMILDFIRTCAERGLMVYTVKDRYVLEDSIQSKVLVTVMGLAAEIERDLLRQRTKEGLRRARERGKVLGRPCGTRNRHSIAIDKGPQILALRAQGLTHRQIAKRIKCNQASIGRYLKEAKNA